ncbi:rho guanine nucleotide exchange factor 18 [Lucilia sericata]|uniref:rho guanine nucleotide exchange factor 18 n=1 Tax=Lucilia sericata TaxID=13632 RepID=UPI0018A85A23|nr:rho guanine nucleotide exchange factor 18 [Lucilia sericata]
MDNNAVQCISTTTAVADDSDNDEVTDFLNSNSSPNALTPLSTVATSITTTTTSSIATANITTETATLNTTTTSFNNIVENSKANLNNINRTNTVESQNYCIPVINTPPPNNNQQHSTQSRQSALTSSSFTSSNNNNNNNNNNTFNSQQLLATKNDNNMIPIINVTPHSPANVSKYNNIFEDTLSQLQNIRESVVQMKNSSTHMNDSLSNYGLVNATILSASLPDLSATGNGGVGSSGVGPYGPLAAHFVMWSPQQQQQYLLNADRRKSWTGIDDLTAGGDCTNKSVSLSSLDSEEQETIRVTEQRRRSARNSTGGISTHSLNEAELARDFERIAAKRSLATEIISRIPLQKSISTSSIVAKEDIKAIARHLTDSEDENQSLLRAHAKIEVYDNVEKRRKRGSLFFRKKKDKTKMKSIGGQVANCDVCGVSLSLGTLKDHQLECKGGGSGSGGKKGSTAGLVGGLNKKSDKNEMGQDFYDGTEQNSNYNDDNTPLIRSEFLNDAPIEAHDLKADPALGICLKEHDSWSPGIPKDILKTLKDTQIKRQEHIYEFIMTEKHHCQTLLVMQKVFVESMERYFPALNCNKMFPRLQELTELHCGFLKKLRLKQKEHFVVDSIADILLEFFSLEKAQHLRLAYGEFCANHRSALEQFKSCMTSRDPTFSEWYKHCLTNPLLKKKGIPECILFVTQRLTKYPLLIEPLLKSAREDKLECDKLQHALALVKELLVDVDACVAEKELRERQIDIYNRIDNKSFAIYKNKPFRKTDVGVESKRRLKFEGLATLMQGRSKMQLVLVVVLTDCLCFLNENSAHNKYMFFTPEHKAGVVPLQKLLIREKAGTESRGIYIISSNPLFPEMYELKVQTPKDKNVWIQSIRQAVLDCPSSDVIESEDLTHEEKLRIGVNKREIIEKIRQKDIEQAILLEEKILLQLNLIQKDQKLFAEQQPQEQQQQQQINNASNMSAAQFLTTFGSYKDLSVGADCDTGELWKKVLNTVQDITQLASTVYTAATGQPVSRSVSSVGEKHSDTYNSPTLPKRAETFAGFDEKRAKNNFPCRADKLGTLQVLSPRLQELEETKKETKNSSIISTLLATAGGEMDSQICDTLNPSGGSLAVTKDNNLALLQVTHNLHTLLCIISQQMTTIQSLQLQLALYRESPRASYTHNDQLEELRNLQDKLQEEKTAWMRQREQQEQELNEKKEALDKMQEQINTQQEDIKQQREQLYRKMEVLSSQGLLISPNTPLNISTQLLQSSTANNANELDNDVHDSNSASNVHDLTAMTNTGSSNANACNTPTLTSVASTVDRRKDKWRTASTISKTPPVNLLSATNAPKTQANVVKQKIPMKLSSLSSTTSNSSSNAGAANKVDKSNSFTTNNHYNSSSAAGITQMFPLKLADKRNNSSTPLASQLIPQHSRTGSSPAIIQHPQTPHNSAANLTSPTPPSSAGVTRTDSSATFTYGQRYSLGSANAAVTSTPTSSRIISHTSAAQTKIPHMSTVTAAASTTSLPSSTNPATSSSTAATSNRPNVQTKPEEEEIYF